MPGKTKAYSICLKIQDTTRGVLARTRGPKEAIHHLWKSSISVAFHVAKSQYFTHLFGVMSCGIAMIWPDDIQRTTPWPRYKCATSSIACHVKNRYYLHFGWPKKIIFFNRNHEKSPTRIHALFLREISPQMTFLMVHQVFICKKKIAPKGLVHGKAARKKLTSCKIRIFAAASKQGIQKSVAHLKT